MWFSSSGVVRESLSTQCGPRGGFGGHNLDILTWFKSFITEKSGDRRAYCRARWPFRAFAQESLKTVTSPTSYRKYPQKGPNLGLPRMLIFWFTFISIEIKLHLVSRGTPLFPLLFYARLGILKQYCRFQWVLSIWRRWRHGFEALLRKSPSGHLALQV